MKPDLAQFLERYSVSGVPAYAMSAVAVCASTAFWVALNPMLGDAAPYVIQVIVLLAATSFGGYGPGLFCLVTLLTLGWFYIPPYDLPLAQRIASEVSMIIAGTIIFLVTATMRAALIKAARAQREADFLSREMNHRVKNLFAVVASMMTLSARDRPQAQGALTELRARLQSLADAHDAAVDQSDMVSFRKLVDRLVAPYRKPRSGDPRILVEGEDVELPYGFTTPMALIFHELATNAVKYGALAATDGTVHLTWERTGDVLAICWQENSAARPAEPGPPGFGTVLVEASVAQMRGKFSRELNGDGLVMRLSVPATELDRKRFPKASDADRHAKWSPSRSSLSAHRVSKRFLRRNPVIRDSRS